MTKQQIIKWLDKYNIKNYHINDNLTVDVDDYVDLSFKELTEIPFQFGKVKGGFNCSYNRLKLLKGCPEIVNGHFWCDNNKLTSLKGCPEEIKGYFFCDDYLKNSIEYKRWYIKYKLKKIL